MRKSKWVIMGISYAVVLTCLTIGNLCSTFLVQSGVAASESSNAFDFDSTDSEASSSSGSGSGSSASEDSSTASSSSSSSAKTFSMSLSTKTYGASTGTVTYHVIDLQLDKLSHLRTHLATNSSGQAGTNIKATVANQIADVESGGSTVEAAINGDYCFYSGRDGYVIRNGTTYRSSRRDDYATYDDFAIFKDGSILSYSEGDYSASTIASMNGGCYQSFCFGPTLVKEGSVNISKSTEVDQSAQVNPRTALGFIDSLHYVFFASEGRTKSYSHGFTLYEVATIMKGLGCQYAYNLDGGGSTTMYYDGTRINTPCNSSSGGYSERAVSDMIYAVKS